MVWNLLVAAAREPNLDARALSPSVGWWLFVTLLAFVALCIVHADRWRSLWLRAEDPRTMGLFRILFGVALLLNLGGMAEQLEFLFTDEGLFSTETAQRVLAAKQFADWHPGEPTTLDEMLDFARGPRFSLLLFRSDPLFFWAHLGVYVAAVVAMTIGFRTRTSAVIAWLLMTSLTARNPIYWTGADVVYKVFFFLLILARSGHAYSLDNWLRCRRLRRLGRLSERGGPGGGAGAPPSPEHPQGLAAVYRRIPAWPRMLMMLQLATIYVYTGSAKTGGIWAAGDSLYYALNLDHFYRTPPQLLSWVFATNAFRLATWTVHFWQIAFPLVLVGLFTRFQIRERFAVPTGAKAWITRILWTVVGVGALAITVIALPVHYTPARGGPSVATVQWLVAGGWTLAMAAIGFGWRRLRDRPPTLHLRGHAFRIDLENVCTWLLGRRLWLTIGVFFHLQIFMLMNIGMFAPIMIMVYLCCLNGTETASVLRALGRVLHRLRMPVPADVRRGEPPIPPERTDLPWLPHDAARMPRWALGGALVAAASYVLVKVFGASGGLGGVFVASGLMVLIVGGIVGWRRRTAPGAVAWAYGPVGRALANAFVVIHVGAVALHCIPAKDSCFAFRSAATETVKPWLTITQSSQSWEMFAPNPTRTNDFLEVIVTDAHGEVWDLHTDANSPRNKDIPWIWYDCAGKITRRVMGEGKWYRKWLARYHCRRWTLDHGGELPRSVELVRVWYDIPKPDEVARHGWYRPAELLAREGKRASLLTVRCAREEDGQPTNELRARHGLPPVDERTIIRGGKRARAETPAAVEAVE